MSRNADDAVKRKFKELTELDEKGDLEKTFKELRRLVIFRGLETPEKNVNGTTTFRGQVWKLLLGVLYEDKKNPVKEYEALVKNGVCKRNVPETNDTNYQAIRNDTHRTMKGADVYDSVKDEPKLIRVLNSFLNKEQSKHYLQGYNLIAGAFLVCMNEVDAYHCFHAFATKVVPTYFTSKCKETCGYIGVYAGQRLVFKILRVVDSDLYQALLVCSKKRFGGNMEFFAKTYFFEGLNSFWTSFQPLSEVIKLWDFLFALGPHMHVVAFVAYLMLLRHKLLDESTDCNTLFGKEAIQKVNAKAVCSLTTYLLPMVNKDKELMSEIERHTTDVKLCQTLKLWPKSGQV